MRFQNKKIFDESAVTSTINSVEVELNHIYGYSVQFIWTSTTASAIIKLQGSNDGTHWTNIVDATQVIADDNGNVLFNEADVFYQFFRGRLDFTSGSVTTLEATYQTKGF